MRRIDKKMCTHGSRWEEIKNLPNICCECNTKII